MSSTVHSGAYLLHGYHYYESRASNAESYLHRLSGQEKEPNIVVMDHCYAKAWNAHPDSHHAKPAKLLFMKDIPHSEGRDTVVDDAVIDVESVAPKCMLPYDGSKARNLMTECERNSGLCNRSEENSDDWDDGTKRTGWTTSQNRIFNKVVKILHANRLAFLTYENAPNEPVLRRLAVDRAADRFRQVFAIFAWDMKILQWLHNTLMEKTSLPYLASYIDILQALKAKVPSLVDKMLAKAVVPGRTNSVAPEALNILLRRPWDPIAPFLNQHKPKRLPGSPLLVVCPGSPGQAMNLSLPRGRFWFSQLSIMGKLITVNSAGTDIDANLNSTLENMVAAVKAKVIELKGHFPSRPIILIGWMIGGVIACQVSLMESVVAVVCLGFPLMGMNGARDVDDPMLDSHTPTLFVIGQNALSCGIDDIENFREHMKAESGLVVVGGADDSLNVSSLKKKMEGVTQSVVDRCIVDEMGAFLAWVLTSQHGAGGAMGHSAPTSKVNGPTPIVGPGRRRVGLRDGSRRVTQFNRRRGRQCHPTYFHDQSNYGGSSTDTTPGSSPPALFSAVGVQPKRGTGRRVGRPPKQVAQKRKFGGFSLEGDGHLPSAKQDCTNADDSSKMLSAATRLEEGDVSVPEIRESAATSAMGKMPLQLASPTFGKLLQPHGLVDTGAVDGSDLVPTPSLWTQSLIAESNSSPSPMSSPVRWFRQWPNKPSSSSSPSSCYDMSAPASDPSPPRSASKPTNHPSPIRTGIDSLARGSEGPATSEELLSYPKQKLTAKDEGKFVSLSASGIKVSILEKSLVGKLPSSRIVASVSDQGLLPPLNVQAAAVRRIVMPATEPAQPSGTMLEKPPVSSFLTETCCEQEREEEQLPFQELEETEDLDQLDTVSDENGADVQDLVKMHPEIVSALEAPLGQATEAGPLGRGGSRGLSSRHRIPFPTIAATRTRRVRMPRFFDV